MQWNLVRIGNHNSLAWILVKERSIIYIFVCIVNIPFLVAPKIRVFQRFMFGQILSGSRVARYIRDFWRCKYFEFVRPYSD